MEGEAVQWEAGCAMGHVWLATGRACDGGVEDDGPPPRRGSQHWLQQLAERKGGSEVGAHHILKLSCAIFHRGFADVHTRVVDEDAELPAKRLPHRCSQARSVIRHLHVRHAATHVQAWLGGGNVVLRQAARERRERDRSCDH